MIPLFHDFDGETVLVVGGGAVGARKAARFATEASVVVVVSPAFHDRFEALRTDPETDLELVREAPDADGVREWVDRLDPVLVVAATDDETINAATEAAAREAGALVNRTDRSGSRAADSVVVPATVADEPVRVALSTGGASPALAKHLRERIDAEIDGAGAMARVSGDIREDLKARGVDPETRREAVREVVRSTPVWKALQEAESKGRQEAERVAAEMVDR
ncbi:NAD(P)-dependent oxidoreductase [Halorubrum gandharaense]